MTFASLLRGRSAEDLAAEFLLGKGWTIVKRNFRVRGAELDLVGLDGDTLVFVEVKQRTTLDQGFPEEAVGPRKIAKLYLAAKFFLKLNAKHAHRDCRFDMIAVQGEGIEVQLRHLQDIACV